MKLFLISRTDGGGWDTFDSAVVAAESEEMAKAIDPAEGEPSWTTIDKVDVKYLGEAAEDIVQGVVLASYNAG